MRNAHARLPADLDLVRSVLKAGSIECHFQPLVSLRRGSVFGVEALARATDPDTGRPVPPDTLFAAARATEVRLELDRLCRERALKAFVPLYRQNPELTLSINVDASVIDTRCVQSGVLDRQVREAGIPPCNVAIEIIESRAGGALALMEFVVAYRRRGYVVALDDFGAGHSNMDRIPLLQPDVLKLDRSLISRIDRHFHKQEIVKSFARMAARTGCLVLGEGVEHLGEALTLLECGVDLFQGYYFGRPAPAPLDRQGAEQAVRRVAEAHKHGSIRRLHAEKLRHSRYAALTDRLCARLSGDEGVPLHDGLEERLLACLNEDASIECLYVLDMNGIQVSHTVCDPQTPGPRTRFYQPAARGTDHSCKEYYLPMRSGLIRFTTEPYLSLASGSRCRTISAVFPDADGQARILCIDLAER